MKQWIGLLATLSFLAAPAVAQGGGDRRGEGEHGQGHGGHESRPEVGRGHIPAHGPERTPARSHGEEGRGHTFVDRAGHPNAPHVDARSDTWVGHDRREERGLRLEHPWAQGRFWGEIGPRRIYTYGGRRLPAVRL